MITTSLEEVRIEGAGASSGQAFSLASFIDEAGESAQLEADRRGCELLVLPVDPVMGIEGNRHLLLAALANVLNNAFKFTCPHTRVTLSAYAAGERVHMTVKDQCGGLPGGDAEKMFSPFTQRGDDKTGLGLGLSIARQSIAADDGHITVEDFPGIGCAFTISLPRHALSTGAC